jgi:hypothetical protein
MPSPSPDPGIQSWFTELRKMQVVCINDSVKKLSLLNFANATIATYLPDPASQNNYLTAVAVATRYGDLETADLTTYKTFRALLDYSHLLENEIFIALRKLSVGALQKANSATYYVADAITAFPGGSAGDPWANPQTGAQALLVASMDPTCYTLPFRIKVNLNVDNAKMGVVIPQIAGLG